MSIEEKFIDLMCNNIFEKNNYLNEYYKDFDEHNKLIINNILDEMKNGTITKINYNFLLNLLNKILSDLKKSIMLAENDKIDLKKNINNYIEEIKSLSMVNNYKDNQILEKTKKHFTQIREWIDRCVQSEQKNKNLESTLIINEQKIKNLEIENDKLKNSILQLSSRSTNLDYLYCSELEKNKKVDDEFTNYKKNISNKVKNLELEIKKYKNELDKSNSNIDKIKENFHKSEHEYNLNIINLKNENNNLNFKFEEINKLKEIEKNNKLKEIEKNNKLKIENDFLNLKLKEFEENNKLLKNNIEEFNNSYNYSENNIQYPYQFYYPNSDFFNLYYYYPNYQN